MRKFIFIFIFLLGCLVHSQKQENPFFGSEKNDEINNSKDNHTNAGAGAAGKPGDPPNPLPIDNYIPLLAVTAVGIILYSTRTKKKLLS